MTITAISQHPHAATLENEEPLAAAKPAPMVSALHDTQATPSRDLSRANGDSQLAQAYAKALQGFTGAPTEDSSVTIEVHPDSTFGQWWAQLYRAAETGDFVSWCDKAGVRAQPIRINPKTGELVYRKRSDGAWKIVGSEDSGWSAVRGPLINAANVLSSQSRLIELPPLEHPNRAPAWLVGRFYHEKPLATASQIRQRAAQLLQDKAFNQETSSRLPQIIEERSEDALEKQRMVLGDIGNRHNALAALTRLGQRLTEGNIRDSEISDYLRETRILINASSSYQRDRTLPEEGRVSVLEYLQYLSLDVPDTAEIVHELRAFLGTPPPQSPLHGNYGGAMSWPRPLDEHTRQQLAAALLHGNVGNLNLRTHRSVLAALMQGVTITPLELRNPRQLLDRLIGSPRGQALGEAIRAKFERLSVAGSANDWLMTALNMEYVTKITRTYSVNDDEHHDGNFNLNDPALSGKSFADVVDSVAEHLYKIGAVPSPELSRLTAYLRLSAQAPELLVKEVPAAVTYGSMAHVRLAVKVACIEAHTPGRTANMTYSEVMVDSPAVNAAHQNMEQAVHLDKVKDWAITNGIATRIDSADDMKTVTDAYNEQVAQLSAASQAQRAPVPPSRKKMALIELRKILGNTIDLEFKCIELNHEDAHRAGPYSLLDMYIENNLHTPPHNVHFNLNERKVSESKGWRIYPFQDAKDAGKVNFTLDEVLNKVKRLPEINQLYTERFTAYGKEIEKSVETQVRHMLAELPLEDRKFIESGQLSIFKEMQTFIKAGGGPGSYEQKLVSENTFLVKVKNGASARTYEFNLKQATVKQRTDLGDFNAGRQDGTRYGFAPGTQKKVGVGEPLHDFMEPVALSRPEHQIQRVSGGPLNSFTSAQTSVIATTLANATSDWKSQEIAGIEDTTFDRERRSHEATRQFFLNLIPFRSAIVNFQNGDLGSCILDLTLDVFGFLTCGVSTGAKVSKVLASAATRATKGVRIAQTLGVGVLSSLNPLDGLPDALQSAGRGVVRAGKRVFAEAANDIGYLRGTHRYDLVAARKQFDSASIGTYKIGNAVTQTPAVYQKNGWYAYDPASGQHYGPALKDFLPSVRFDNEQFGKWATAQDPAKKIDDAIVNNWKNVVATHRNGAQKAAFERGYNAGQSYRFKGLSPSSKIEDLMKLAANQTLSAEQVGVLVRRYDDLAYTFGLKGAQRFIHIIEPRYGSVMPMPQVVYFSQTAQLSDGQCAALSRVMATAIEHGKEKQLIQNMFTAAAFPKDPASRRFIEGLRKLQTQVGGQSSFHAGKPVRQLSPSNMVKELDDSTVSQSIMIDSPGHAMAAGVTIDAGNKRFWFYDPNYGHATFASAADMKDGLIKLFNDKKLEVKYKTHSTDPNVLEFKVFDHDDAWQQRNSVFSKDVKALYEQPLVPTPVTPIPALPVQADVPQRIAYLPPPVTVVKRPIKIRATATPDEVQAIVNKNQTIKDVGGIKKTVYSGLVFRGDTRPPLANIPGASQGVFDTGFTLRTPINDIREVNGTRGAFGGGHDALDPDGKGISTSAFYNRGNAGAYFYGGHKGGHTYLVDGRDMEGFHLYANRHAIEHPGDKRVNLLPWEINYGTDIPGHRIIGAFDSAGTFIPNPNYASTSK